MSCAATLACVNFRKHGQKHVGNSTFMVSPKRCERIYYLFFRSCMLFASRSPCVHPLLKLNSQISSKLHRRLSHYWRHQRRDFRVHGRVWHDVRRLQLETELPLVSCTATGNGQEERRQNVAGQVSVNLQLLQAALLYRSLVRTKAVCGCVASHSVMLQSVRSGEFDIFMAWIEDSVPEMRLASSEVLPTDQ